MATIYDAIDVTFTYNGDFIPGVDGDFDDTSADQIQSLVQEIQTIANSSLGDWQENPSYAATLDDFIGLPNTRETARQLTERLRVALITNNVVNADDLTVRTIPIDKHKLLIMVSVAAAATPNNSLTSGTLTTVSLVYDYSEQGIINVNVNDE